MAGNTRGKLKEEMEGIHRDCEWIKQHCTKCIALIGDTHPELIKAFEALSEMSNKLDEFTMQLYAGI